MSADPRRIIVTEGCCEACDAHTVLVHHQDFPKMRIEGISSEQAAEHLVDQLTAALDSVCDPARRATTQAVIDDARAFLDREGAVHPARDLSAPGAR